MNNTKNGYQFETLYPSKKTLYHRISHIDILN